MNLYHEINIGPFVRLPMRYTTTTHFRLSCKNNHDCYDNYCGVCGEPTKEVPYERKDVQNPDELVELETYALYWINDFDKGETILFSNKIENKINTAKNVLTSIDQSLIESSIEEFIKIHYNDMMKLQSHYGAMKVEFGIIVN